jgi:hypothetical protein
MGAADGSERSDRDGGAGSWWTTTQPETPDGELAAIVRRAAELGIPAWRVSVALGRPLPKTDGD